MGTRRSKIHRLDSKPKAELTPLLRSEHGLDEEFLSFKEVL